MRKELDTNVTTAPPPPATTPTTVVIVMPLAEQKGGGELMLLHLMQQGLDLGIAWHVVFLQSGPMVDEVRRLGGTATVIDAGRMREVHRIFATARAIARLARRERAALIFGWMGTGHLYGGLAARFAHLPAAWYQLGIPLDKSRLDRLVARIPARAVVTLSKAGQAAQNELTPNVLQPLVYPAVELERFEPSRLPSQADARKMLGLPEGVPLIGLVGRLQRWKGMHVLIDAVPRLRTRFPNAQAVIVGGKHDPEPEYEGQLREQIKRLNVGDAVRMVGLQKNVPVWMQAMDIIVHASDHEPFGIVIIEAMSLGKPVVATDAAGPTEIITPGVHGLLTPYGDSARLADALTDLLEHPDKAARIAHAARTRAQDFSTRRYAENLAQAVRQIISG